MLQVSDWQHKKERYEQYWNQKNDTPLLYVFSQSDQQISNTTTTADRDTIWFDPGYKIKKARIRFQNTYFGGDAYPYVSPTLGNDLLSAILGLDIIYNESSAWAVHRDCELSELQDFTINRENFYFKKAEEILNAFAEDAKQGDYIVGMLDLNTLLDGISSLVGPEKLCFETMDHPQEVKRVVEEHFMFFQKVYAHYNDIVTRYQGGSTNWLAIYSEIPWYFISVDFMVMLSGDAFDEFVSDPLRRMAAFHERSLLHLDGENAVIHLEQILRIKEITGVQVQATPAAQSAEFWIPHLKKIQQAGKVCWIEARHKDDVKQLINNLNPEGLFIKLWADSVEEARETEAMVAHYYGKGFA